MFLKRAIIILIAVLSFSVLSGCIFLVAGTVGAVGGYAITKDTMQGDYDASFKVAWKATSQVCGIMGVINPQDQAKGVVEALVDRAKVTVTISQLTPKAIRLKVKARKGIFPKLGIAEKVFVKIVQQLM